MTRIHVLISGLVQGIGFRYYIKDRADELGLVGWVQNTHDGRVEAVIEGSKDRVDTFVKLCKEGPLLASVDSVKIVTLEAKRDLVEFTVK